MTSASPCYVVLLAVFVQLLPIAVNSELVLVYSIQRHGARNVLPKSALLTEVSAAGGPTLLPSGQQMCLSAGSAFHQRYISQKTCSSNQPSTCLSAPGHERYGVVNTAGVGFNNYNSFTNSSALDRTIMSANSFLAGVFPQTVSSTESSINLKAVPVYSVAESEDWHIRGYSKCPAYQQRLATWLQSETFQQQEQATQSLRQQVQASAPELNTSLAQWWGVYDSFNVWRNYGVGNAMPDIDNATYEQVVELAMWLETAKMSPELTGNLLGGGLLGDMLTRMAAAEETVSRGSQAPYYKLLFMSSHYNTQLGVLSALQAAVHPSRRTRYPWQQKIPALASVLVFELHRTPAGQFVVRAVYQDGPAAPYRVLPLPCAAAGDAAEAFAGAGSCTLDGFRQLAGSQAFNSSADWCEACNNKEVMACQLRNMERQLIAVGIDPLGAAQGAPRGTRKHGTSPGMVAVWCVVSVAAAALLAGAALLALKRLRKRGGLTQQLRGMDRMHGVAQTPVDLSRPAPV